ncbi:MAG: hypothetical protein IJS45_12060 [Clostridia bacterium]|nr:hypothetical protein [Clostridia bacterium]
MENEKEIKKEALTDEELSEVAGGAASLFRQTRLRRCATKGCKGYVPPNSTGIYCTNCAAGKTVARL